MTLKKIPTPITPKQLQDCVEAIVAATADRYGWTISALTDRIESENQALFTITRKLIYDRVRRAAHSLAKRGLVEMARGTIVTFHPKKAS